MNINSLETYWSPQVFAIHDLDSAQPPPLAQALTYYPDHDRDRVTQKIKACIETGIPYELECDFISAKGRKKRVRCVGQLEKQDDGTELLIGIFKDITAQYEQGAALWRAAHIDALTSIPNRLAFQSEFRQRIEANRDGNAQLALLMMDLDNFKDINDDLGHLAGDQVLREVAQRILRSSCENAFCARLGGDEFAILLTVEDGSMEPEELAALLRDQFTVPIRYEQIDIQVGVSIGIASCGPEMDSEDDLLRKADVALYHVKQNGRGKIQTYEPAFTHAFEEKRRAVMLIKSAIAGRRLEPYYQPIVDLQTHEIRGVEALARVRNEDGTISGPADFWHALIDPQCAQDIDEVILDRALEDFARWKRCGSDLDFVSVNASSSSIIQSDEFVERVLERLCKNGLSPTDLKIEVVESVFLESESTDVGKILERLSCAGVRIALDDFGTGYASLSHLRDYPIDCIKIDKSFVLGLGENGCNTAIVQALIGLGKSMKLNVVAEGIETVGQLDFVSALGSNFGQGYLFSKPVNAEGLVRLMAKWANKRQEHGGPKSAVA